MAIPSIYFLTPTAGHSGGATLVEIAGEGFAMPQAPNLTTPGLLPDPAPSVAVYFGGKRCTTVWVIHSGLVRCLTPRHSPSGLPARELDETRRIPARDAIPASDVTVQNLDANGVAIAGELATLPTAYSFLRPNTSQPGAIQTVMESFLQALSDEVIENVNFNPHTDYDPASGDASNVAILAYIPGIAIVGFRCPDSELQEQELKDEDFPDPDADASAVGQVQTIVRRSADNVDLIFTAVGVSDNQGEILTLYEAMKIFVKKSKVDVPLDPTDPNSAVASFVMEAKSDSGTDFTGRIDNSNVLAFSYEIAIRRVPIGAMPGLPNATVRGVVTRGTVEDIVDLQTKGFTPLSSLRQR